MDSNEGKHLTAFNARSWLTCSENWRHEGSPPHDEQSSQGKETLWLLVQLAPKEWTVPLWAQNVHCHNCKAVSGVPPEASCQNTRVRSLDRRAGLTRDVTAQTENLKCALRTNGRLQEVTGDPVKVKSPACSYTHATKMRKVVINAVYRSIKHTCSLRIHGYLFKCETSTWRTKNHYRQKAVRGNYSLGNGLEQLLSKKCHFFSS